MLALIVLLPIVLAIAVIAVYRNDTQAKYIAIAGTIASLAL